MRRNKKLEKLNNSPILLPRARNFSEPPRDAPEESRAKQSNLPPVDFSNYSITFSTFPSEKPLINLKQVLAIEERLAEILEKLRQNVPDKGLCDDYWSITEDSAIPGIEKLFTEKRTQTSLRHAFIIEVASIAFANITFNDKLPQDIIQQFLNLFYYVHQNFLSVMKLVLYRCSHESLSNTWIHMLRDKIQEKQANVVKKGGVSGFIKHHTALACKLLENIMAGCNNTQRALLANVLKSLYCPSYVKAKRLIENVLVGMPTVTEYSEDLSTPVTVPYLGLLDKPYTLILDLDETLVHYVDNGPESRLNVRPGCNDFLVEVQKYYEVVIFTAALQDYADWAIDSIDLQKSIKSRLYRQHTIPTGPVFIKDLSRLGRNLSKVIIVDNVAENFRLQPENGLFIKSWFEDTKDTCLSETLNLLREIAVAKVPDVRTALRNYRDQVLRQIIKGVPNPHLNLILTK